MEIDQIALAKMTAMSVMLGACFGLLLELLRFAGGVFYPRMLDNSGSTNKTGVSVWLFFRDIIFFIISGVVFSVFVYCTNDGVIRFSAVLGTLTGFFIFYFTLGRFIRKLSYKFLIILYRIIGVILFPFVFVIKKVSKFITKFFIAFIKYRRKIYTVKQIKKLSVQKFGYSFDKI